MRSKPTGPPLEDSTPAQTRVEDRLARLQKRHGGGTSPAALIGATVLAAIALGLLLKFALPAGGGARTPPLSRELLVACVAATPLALWIYFRSSQVKLWRASRRRPWWMRRFRPGKAISCAYCRDSLPEGELPAGEQVSCPKCHAAYHSECQAELGCCASLGCAGLGPAPTPRSARRAKVR